MICPWRISRGRGLRIRRLLCARFGAPLGRGDPTAVLAAGECGAVALRHRFPEAGPQEAVPRMGVRWVERKVWKILWKMKDMNDMNEMNEMK